MVSMYIVLQFLSNHNHTLLIIIFRVPQPNYFKGVCLFVINQHYHRNMENQFTKYLGHRLPIAKIGPTLTVLLCHTVSC